MGKTPSKIDPVCGKSGTIKSHSHYFCSKQCIEKYIHKNKIDKCSHCDFHLPWYRQKITYVSGVFALILLVSYFACKPLFSSIINYIRIIWPAIVLSLMVGGLIEYFIPSEYVSQFLSKRKKRTVLYAVLLGFLMSSCSHGIVAIAIELYRKGASVPAVIAFLMSAPWTNFTILFMLTALFGLKGLLIIAGATIIAVSTGFAFLVLDKFSLIEKNRAYSVKWRKLNVLEDIKSRIKKYNLTASGVKRDVLGVLSGGWILSKMVLWWMLIGILIASAMHVFIPASIFQSFFGPTIIGLLLTLAFAIVIEVCSEGSSPLAFEIFSKTGAFGNAFVFLMAGVSADYTEMGILWSNIGKKTVIWLVLISLPQVILLGYLMNILL